MSSVTSAVAAANARPVTGRPALLRTASAIVKLTVARTFTPALLVTMAGLVVLPMLFALMFAARGFLSGDPVPFLVSRYDELVGAFATPVIALLLSTSAFSAESEDGTLLYLVTTRTPRWWIVLVRMTFAIVGTALASAIAIFGAGAIVTGAHDPENVTRAFGIASAFGGAAYASLFTVLTMVTRRALVGGLVYVVFWEQVLSSTFPGIHYLSVRQWMLAVAREFTTVHDARLTDAPALTASLISAGVVVFLAIAIGARRLAQPRVGRIGT